MIRMPDSDRLTADVLFFAALELHGEARERYVAEACQCDPELRTEVESLLTAHEQAGSFLRTPAAPRSVGASSDHETGEAFDLEVWIGRRIGAYRVERLIGAGGMGAVFAADRVDGEFHQKVAIKLIRPGMASADVLRRFRTERQVLARLEHPNIARLIDGGATDDGLPYLVMDYVEGVPIDDYCRRSRLTVSERLVLFRKVCAPVEYAHRHLVVHRDLKPGNILISSDGEPKLLDFGVAKVLGASTDESGLATTAPAVRILTPRYASPEQIRGLPITTGTDVYSLGVILYELLTGLRPFDVQTNSLQELERLICTQEPHRPSTIVRRAASRRAGRRDDAIDGDLRPADPTGADLRRLARSLAGDLDNIVLTALRREPHRRYTSVSHLSDDIQKHLDGLTVTARPDTWRYRASKFVFRNAVVVGATAVMAAGLLATTAVSTALYYRADAATREKEAQRAVTEQINRFLQDMLTSIDPAYARGRDVSIIRQVVDQAADRIENELTDAPGVAASLHLTLGNVYAAIASHDLAERHLRRSLELRQTEARIDRLAQAENLLALARLLRDRSRYDEAEPLFRESLRIRESLLGPDHADVAEALASLGLHLEHRGNYPEAETAYRRAISIQDRDPRQDALATSSTLSNLGLYLMYQNRESQAGGR
jgi:serine/threonine-protein kinase